MAQNGKWGEFWRSVILIILGAAISQGLDYWAKFIHVASQIDADLLGVSPAPQALEVNLAFVNSGNRDGAISQVEVVGLLDSVGVDGHASPFGPPTDPLGPPTDWTIDGLPVLLEPGRLRLAKIRGKFTLNELLDQFSKWRMWHYDQMRLMAQAKGGTPVPIPTLNIRGPSIGLRISAIDFSGRHFESFWPLATVIHENREFATPSPPSPRWNVFDERFEVSSWFSRPVEPFPTRPPPR